MASIVWTDLTKRVAALSVVDIDVQADVLTFVNGCLDTRLFNDGEADASLRLARIYLALHFATGDASNGVGDGTGGPAGPVTQESAGGMMRQYEALGAGDPLLAESYWGRRFLQIVRARRFGFLTL